MSIPQCCKGSPRALGSNGESKIQRCCSSTCVHLEPEASGELSLQQSLIAWTEPGRQSDTSIFLLFSCHPPVKPQITHLFCSQNRLQLHFEDFLCSNNKYFHGAVCNINLLLFFFFTWQTDNRAFSLPEQCSASKHQPANTTSPHSLFFINFSTSALSGEHCRATGVSLANSYMQNLSFFPTLSLNFHKNL